MQQITPEQRKIAEELKSSEGYKIIVKFAKNISDTLGIDADELSLYSHLTWFDKEEMRRKWFQFDENILPEGYVENVVDPYTHFHSHMERVSIVLSEDPYQARKDKFRHEASSSSIDTRLDDAKEQLARAWKNWEPTKWIKDWLEIIDAMNQKTNS